MTNDNYIFDASTGYWYNQYGTRQRRNESNGESNDGVMVCNYAGIRIGDNVFYPNNQNDSSEIIRYSQRVIKMKNNFRLYDAINDAEKNAYITIQSYIFGISDNINALRRQQFENYNKNSSNFSHKKIADGILFLQFKLQLMHDYQYKFNNSLRELHTAQLEYNKQKFKMNCIRKIYKPKNS